MYKGFCEDVEYVMGLFFRPFEGCSEKEADDDEDEEERKCGMACDGPACFRENDADDNEDEDEDRGCGMGCGEEPDKKPEGGEPGKGGLLGPGPLKDIMKCMFDASDIDYDYED